MYIRLQSEAVGLRVTWEVNPRNIMGLTSEQKVPVVTKPEV